MKKFIKKIVLGNHFQNEFLCINKINFQKPLSVYLVCPSLNEKSDISSEHFLLGYKPLLIGIRKTALQNFRSAPDGTEFTIQFCFASNLIAEIKTVRIKPLPGFENEIIILKGIKEWHNLQSFVQKKINGVVEFLKKKPAGNIYLSGNLYDQVRIGYSVPRTIALVIVKQGGHYNIFPTDLHGKISEKLYMDSLRIDNKANAQIVSAKQIVIAFMKAEMYKTVYLLGFRHNKEFCHTGEFSFLSDEKSQVLDIRLPIGHVGYVELELLSSQVEGIHSLNYFKILYEKPVEGNSLLAQVHSLIVNWRVHKNISTEYFIR